MATTSTTTTTTITLVDTVEKVRECVAYIAENMATPIYVDIEGVDLSRTGKLCLLQVLCRDRNFLVDVSVLGPKGAFETTAGTGAGHASAADAPSLKSILEGTQPLKIMYDCRNDADALLHQCGVCINGVFDCQVADVYLRRTKGFNVKFVSGLARCIQEYLPVSVCHGFDERKKETKVLFSPELGGNPSLWDTRPLPDNLLAYAADDVKVLQPLYDSFRLRLSQEQHDLVVSYSARFYLSERHLLHAPTQGKERAIAPKW